jgi:hypothetical protein
MNCRNCFWIYFGALLLVLLSASNSSWAQAITLLSPNSAQATSISRQTEPLNLLVFGQGFTKSQSVRWKGRALPTTFVNSTKLAATVSSGEISVEGTAEVTVGDECAGSVPATFTITQYQVPRLTYLAPSTVKAGGSGFRLNVVGMNMPRFPVIQWNRSDRQTNSFNDTTADAAISASDIIFPGIYDVVLIDGGISAAVSNTLSVTVMVSAPPPVIETLSPAKIEAGYIPFQLLVTGKNFTPTSVVRWNGADRETQFFDTNSLVANILDTDVSTPSQAEISVMETAPGGSLSDKVKFAIVTNPAVIFPQFVAGGGYSTTLTVVNIGSVEVNGKLSLFNQAGEPFSGVTQTADPLQQPASVVPISLPPGSMRVFKVDNPPAVQGVSTGWAKVEGGRDLRGYATVQVRNSGILRNSSTVASWDPLPYAEIPIDNDFTEDRFTGLTVANFDEAAINLKLAVYDENGRFIEMLAPSELNPLKPRQQISKFVHEYFPAIKGTFKGSLVLFSPDYKNFVTVGLVQSQGLLSIIPAVAGPYFALPQ